MRILVSINFTGETIRSEKRFLAQFEVEIKFLK